MIRTVEQALKLYANNPALENSFGQSFGKNLIALNRFPDNPKKACYQFTFPRNHVNIQNTVHGGALATMVDIATTISIIMLTPLRTISISLNTQFLSIVKLEQKVQIQTYVTKLGKTLVFSQCSIFTGIDKGERILSCRGSHTKAVMKQPWDFIN